MAMKFSKGVYSPKNKEKYVGKGSIIYRSSWELTFCQFCDNNKSILEWSSEPLRIPYRNPVTNKQTTYVPDFLIRYRDKSGKIITEMIEIKPYAQTVLSEKTNPKTRATIAVNHAKWKQAIAFCGKRGIRFRIVTEKDLYRT